MVMKALCDNHKLGTQLLQFNIQLKFMNLTLKNTNE